MIASGKPSTHLARAERLLGIGDSASIIHFVQLAIENFAKAIIALYEVLTCSHDSSSQLLSLIVEYCRVSWS
jgi:hypothetical protein